MNTFKRVLRIISYVFIGVATCGLVLCMLHNDTLDVNRFNVKNNKINKSFKAVVISDYHHRELKFKNGNLIDKVKEENPDVVFFTGDMIDQHTKNLDDLTKMFDAFNGKQMFYVTGNHEQYAPLWNDVKTLMNDKGVKYLDGTTNYHVDLKFGSEETNVRIYGVDDPKFSNPKEPYFQKNYGNLKEVMKKWEDGDWDSNKFNLLLVHRPELMDLYAETGFDYVLCGHTHGGQVKLFNSWTPALIGQGLVPKYVAGEYKEKDTTMYVTKGLGHSAMLPIRVHCNPEILSITFGK